MSLTIEHVLMPPKSQEVSQLHTNETTRMEHEQQQVASQFQAEVERSSEQTVRRNKAENEELKNEEKNRRQQSKKKKGQKKASDADKDLKKKSAAGAENHFDLRI